MSRKRQLNIHQDQYRSRGAFITLEQLFDQRHVAKSIELDYQSRSRLGMSGSHISKHKGRGVDFEEFRAYQPGDDIRQIDWRVTARTGRPFTKVFREERERPVIIGIDQCHNMFFRQPGGIQVCCCSRSSCDHLLDHSGQWRSSRRRGFQRWG